MDSGAVTAVKAANEELPERNVIELKSIVNVETVTPLIQALNAAVDGDVLEIHIRHNGGGEVDSLIALLRAIVSTKAQVDITIGRYVMSAAATLWLWFWLWPVPHVNALMPLKPAVLMYHRPRQSCGNNGDYYCFAESLKDGDPVKQSLLDKIKIFDELFDALLQRLGWSSLSDASLVLEDVSYQHHLQHLKEAYYGNKDCVFPVFPDQGATHEDVRAE
jgi:ATP-dependent protease ClpP protease subunit